MFFGQMTPISTFIRMMARKTGEGQVTVDRSSVKPGEGSVMAWAGMADSGTGTVVTQDRTRRLKSEVFRDVLSAQIQPNAAKLIGLCFTIQMDNEPKQATKATHTTLDPMESCHLMQKSLF